MLQIKQLLLIIIKHKKRVITKPFTPQPQNSFTDHEAASQIVYIVYPYEWIEYSPFITA